MLKEKNTNYQNLTPDQQPVPIVAIGGSAGGQQAITELLDHLPSETGLAYVYIQHLSPDFESKLDDILSAHTSMRVREAEHLMQVEPDHLYIIPPGKDLEVIDGVLSLMPRKPRPQLHLPIDQFFISLANRQKDGAIGVVLSGMASDGTAGLQAIKVAGGITFAQDETALYSSMPLSAISEGVVDMVLSPKEIALELSRISKHAQIFQLTNESVQTDADDSETSDDEDLRKILLFIKSAVGSDFTHYKKTTIRRRVLRRMLLYKLETLKDYVQYLKKNPSEAGILYNDLLINVTNFFRDKETMAHLKKQVLPWILKNKPANEPLRIWIAGCSTGQEAFSIAMILMEIIGDRAVSIPIQIFATDLSESAINKARLGVYTAGEVADVSAARLDRFFTRSDENFRINKFIRDLCIFAPHNVLIDPPFSRLDLISCRNLLIYLDDVLQKKVLATFHYALNPEGVLLLGKSESTGSSPVHFTQVDKLHKIFTRKNNVMSRMPLDMHARTVSRDGSGKVTSSKNNEVVTVSELDKLVDNLLLSKYVPASVVVDQDLEIIQFRGEMNLFLHPSQGKASLNLTKMAHASLVFELRNIVHKARKSAQAVKKSGLEILVSDRKVYVDIEAAPVTNPANQQLFLILFEQVQPNTVLHGENVIDAYKINSQLEAELAALRQDMHSIIEEQEASNEELQSANEEITSSNEELQSINEELETSKEEIESANEELQTINQELQVRNDQLTESYEYSEAILSTINEATLVLDSELRIRNANDAFYRIFQSTAQQTEGRMIYELGNQQLNFLAFQQMLHEVKNNSTSVRGFEVTLKFSKGEMRTMLVHARKLVQQRKQTILIVFEDITEHRRAQTLLQERQRWFEELVDNTPALIRVTDTRGEISFLNKAWTEFTGESFEKTNPYLFLEAIHPADQEAYKSAVKAGAAKRDRFSFEYRLRRHDGDFRWVLENSRPMFSQEGEFTGYIASCTEVHLQKTLTQQLNQHVDERTSQLRDANQELESANNELTQTADRLQSVLNGVLASVTLMEPVLNDQGQIIDFTTSAFNQKALELVGLTESEMTTQTLLKSNPVFRESQLIDLFIKVMTDGESAYKEVSGLNSNPDETYAFLITRQIDRKGIVVTALDISSRKKAEIELTRTANNLQAVLDSSPASIGFFKVLYDDENVASDFQLLVCNQKFGSVFEIPSNQLIGKFASELYSPEYIEKMRQVLATGAPYHTEYEHTDGRWRGTSLTRHHHGIAVTELDITALKSAQHQQDHLISQLDGSFKMIESLAVMKEYVQHRGSFLRSSFHDLRGSFGIIVGAASLLNMMDTEEERAKVLDMIQRNLSHVTLMMNQLLDYSRLESGEEKLEIVTFDAGEMLTELCEGSISVARDKKLSLQYAGPASLVVEGDTVKVRRIAQNLLLNAIKYTHEGSVSVSWSSVPYEGQEDARWQFSVQDTGPGISKDLISRLSDSQHHQTAEARTVAPIEENKNQGEGIGLFIVRRLCELLGAEMQISSDPDSGTVFFITFPQTYQ